MPKRAAWLWLTCLGLAPIAAAQQVELPGALTAGDSGLAASMPAFARRVLATYGDTARDTYLDNRFRLEIVAGSYSDAAKTLAALRDLRRANPEGPAPAASVQYQIYAQAKAAQAAAGIPFGQAFAQSFRAVLGGLDDRTAAYEVPWVFGTLLKRLEGNLRSSLDLLRGRSAIPLSEAVDLVRRYLAVEAYRSFRPLTAALQEEDDQRRYLIEKDLLVPTPDGAAVCVLVLRPRAGPARLPALLNFSIYADSNHINEVRLTAAHGYAGVGGLTRGKGCSPDHPVPIEHDGTDAAALIDWIARQPWSDGRVGMYGGSYDGFTQWAAAKHMPRALKALMPSVTFAPGVDFPMEGNVFMTYAYPWPFYTTNGKGLDDATYYDAARWERLKQQWYARGLAYRSLDKLDGTPNQFFDRWLDHPSYDTYWRRVIPYGREFARIDIPVLTTTGYYDSGQIGALHYFIQHHRYRPGAEHYLVIGPYDHIRGQRGTISPTGNRMTELREYRLDPVAQIDIMRLRYQWFDYVFRGAPKPALLQDKVNYEVMGANRWKHAPSLAAMSERSLRLYLSAIRAGAANRLTRARPGAGAFIAQGVDLADRSDSGRTAADSIIDQALDSWSIIGRAPRIGNALEFVSEPLAAPAEVSGLFSGRLAFISNKADFDFSVTLFELTPAGDYFQLSYYWARASYVADPSHRRLLSPGKRGHLDFTSGRLTSRRLQPGSRLVVVLGIIKQPGEQINYGTGKDVSDETIADAKEPLRIQWSNRSFIDLPVSR